MQRILGLQKIDHALKPLLHKGLENNVAKLRYKLKNYPRLENRDTIERSVDINRFAEEALTLTDPPLKFLWIACRNPLSQDQDRENWLKLLNQLELVVTVDLFMNETTAQSDIVLPAASPFEEYDLHQSYWHQWIAINEKAIPSFYEAKSDLEITRELTKTLNALKPNFSDFRYELTALEWIEAELTPELLNKLKIGRWEELLQGPRKLLPNEYPENEQGFGTETGKFEALSMAAKQSRLPAMACYQGQEKDSPYPLRLLTPQSLFRVHSQYRELTWLDLDKKWEDVQMNSKDTEARGLKEKDYVKVFNDRGDCQRRVRITPDVPQGVVVMVQGGKDPVNKLMAGRFADMGTRYSGSRGAAFFDVWVEVSKNPG